MCGGGGGACVRACVRARARACVCVCVCVCARAQMVCENYSIVIIYYFRAFMHILIVDLVKGGVPTLAVTTRRYKMTAIFINKEKKQLPYVIRQIILKILIYVKEVVKTIM